MPDHIAPLVCICIPTYNSEKTIRETLASIINQSYTNLDIRLVDNSSTDDTLKIAAEFADARIKIHRSDVNVGAEGNFNRCIQLATGKYTAIYHADDVYEVDMVQRQVDFLEASSAVGAVFTEARLIDEGGGYIGAKSVPPLPNGNGSAVVLDFAILVKAILLHSNFLICPSAMLRTDIYRDEIGSWRYDLFGSSSDLDIWFRVAERYPIAILRVPLMRYRISVAQGTHTVARRRTNRADFFRVTDYYLKQPKTRALLTAEDYRNYGWLERADRTIRAMNFFLEGQIDQARELIRGSISLDAMTAALNSSRGFMTLLLAGFMKFAIAFHMINISKVMLQRIRKRANK